MPSTNGNAARVESLPRTKVARLSVICMAHHTAGLWQTCVIETLADTVMRPLLREFYPVRSHVCCRTPNRLHGFSFSSQYSMIIGGISQPVFSFRYYSFVFEAISVGASLSENLHVPEIWVQPPLVDGRKTITLDYSLRGDCGHFSQVERRQLGQA